MLALTKQRGELNLLQRDVDAAQKAYDAVSASAAQSHLQSLANQTNVMRLASAVEPLDPSGLSPTLRCWWPPWRHAAGIGHGVAAGTAQPPDPFGGRPDGGHPVADPGHHTRRGLGLRRLLRLPASRRLALAPRRSLA